MAVESSISFAVYNGTGSASVGYPIPFSYTDPDHIKVSIQAAADTEPTVLTPSQYDVSADPAAVYTLSAYPSTTKITLERVIPYTQPTVWPEGGRFLAATHEAAADRAVMQIQQLARDVGQSIRVPLASGVPAVLAPTPGALIGFDGAGEFVHYDATRVRELALLAAIDAGNPIATWATEGDRASTPPDFVGQIGAQRDDKSLWVGNSTTGGDWTKALADLGDIKIVRTVAQFEAALAAGGRMRIVSSLTLPNAYTITAPVDIEGAPGVVLTLAHTATYGFLVQATTRFQDIRITGPNRTSMRAFAIGGSRYAGSFVLQRVAIHNVGNALCLDGAASSVVAPHVMIDDCDIYAIGAAGYTGGGGSGGDGAIALTWNLSQVNIVNNRIWDTYGNAIYIGQSGLMAGGQNNTAQVPNMLSVGQIFIHNNWIRDFDRNGIEVFGADYAVVSFNRIIGGTGIVAGAGISLSFAGSYGVCHGNIVRDYWGYGIEVVHHHNIVTCNLIDTCTHDRSNVLLAMSVGGRDTTSNCLIASNIFRNIVNKVHPHIAISFATSTDCAAVNNKFYDVSIACQVASGANESITFVGNEHRFANGGNLLDPALYPTPSDFQWTFSASGSAGTKHVVMSNVTRNKAGAAATIAQFYKFGVGSGGYVNYTSGQQIHGGSAGTYLELGATSNNLVIP